MELNKESIYKLSNIEDIKKFIVGGKAIITLESKKTGRWFTYKIQRNKNEKNNPTSPLFVSVLTGSDNESSYTYMGTIFCNDDKLDFKLTKNSKISEKALSYLAFNYFFVNLMKNVKHVDLDVYHRGICCRCGRAITVPESLITGFGPECYKINHSDLIK